MNNNNQMRRPPVPPNGRPPMGMGRPPMGRPPMGMGRPPINRPPMHGNNAVPNWNNIESNNGTVDKKHGLFASRKAKHEAMQAEIAQMRAMQNGGVAPNIQVQNTNVQVGPMKPTVQKPQSGPVKPGQAVTKVEKDDFSDDDYVELTLKDWIVMLTVLAIPLVNIYYIITNMNNMTIAPYKRMFLKAYGIYLLCGTIISVILSFIIKATMG